MKQVEIRLANIGDSEHIDLLGRITFSETFGHLFRDPQDLRDYYDRTFSVAKIQSSFKKSNNVFWLALVDDLPIGYAKLKLQSPSPFIASKKVSQLQKIYVLKDFLSMKAGLQLQNALIARAAEAGSEVIWLSVLNENERAINFYYRNDFVKVGHHDFSIGKEDFEFTVLARDL